MPTSVSAMRTGVLPSRGSGVTVFVTNASSARATCGAAIASRHPEALSSTEHRPLDAQPLEAAVDLDGAAVARSEAASHRRFPCKLRAGCDGPHGFEHRLRPTRQDVQPGGDQLRDERGLDA